MLKIEERRELLRLARGAIEARLSDPSVGFAEPSEPGLKIGGGAFVSLHRGNELRGCIGRVLSPAPLYLTVQEMAVAAATQDFRFSSVRAEELAGIDIEISVLSIPRLIAGVEEIRVGEHGLIVRSGASSGLLLPQVAAEYGWGLSQE
ncbi:MAG: AmmeMemoRadiSam system protein A [Deltaproteobacteria bacterium]|nr:AmmeMemoRadiSam system protein A [Deltaproteobacteria bacterium]